MNSISYRIEKGEATLPIEEINRLNDLATDLKNKELKLREKEKELEERYRLKEEKLLEGKEVAIKTIEPTVLYTDRPYGYRTSYNFVDKELELKLRNSVLLEEINKNQQRLAKLSIRGFLQWRKLINRK